MLDKTATIENFLEAAAAKQPTPGGGSVAALAGALAAAMGEMVLNYSVGKKGLELATPLLQLTIRTFHVIRDEMLELMSQDQLAYEALTAAKKLPTVDPKRDANIYAATKLCVETPQRIAKQAVLVLDLANDAVGNANHYLLSDLAVCAELAMATTRIALYNVRVNLPELTDENMQRKIEEDCEQLLSEAVGLIQQVIPRIWERVSKS